MTSQPTTKEPTADPSEATADTPQPTKRGRPRLGKAVATAITATELLVIAADVFYKLGFEGTRLDDIAAEAGIVKGSLYHYFDSKEHIYQRLVESIRGSFDAAVEVPESLPPKQRLEIFAVARARQVAENPVELGIFARQMVKMDGVIGDWARELARNDLALLRGMIVQGQKTRDFRPGDPDVLARLVMGSWIYLVGVVPAFGHAPRRGRGRRGRRLRRARLIAP